MTWKAQTLTSQSQTPHFYLPAPLTFMSNPSARLPLSSSQTLEWDARGDDGAVVAEGTWTVSISAIDGQDNVSSACSSTVVVTQAYRELP